MKNYNNIILLFFIINNNNNCIYSLMHQKLPYFEKYASKYITTNNGCPKNNANHIIKFPLLFPRNGSLIYANGTYL